MATVKSPVLSRDELAQNLAAEIMASLNTPSVTPTASVAINKFLANRIADSGDGLAEISAGFSAAATNFKVSRQAAIVRQNQRTAQKVAALVEAELVARGM